MGILPGEKAGVFADVQPKECDGGYAFSRVTKKQPSKPSLLGCGSG